MGAAGVPSQPNVFYVGVNNGGVWKTTDFGQTWNPIFDDQPTGSIGCLAVAPSDPNTLYVGSGEGLQRPDLSTGDGVYKSSDGGKTWQHLGLRDGQQIGAIIVDPQNPNRLFVAVLGHPYGANEERGVFRSTDGGATFHKVLYKDANTGAIALCFDPTDSNTIYADLFAAQQGPWENGEWQGPGSGLYKSVDGGNSWAQLTKGLPTYADGLGRIGMSVAPSDPKRMYAVVDAKQGGIYRSDDAGENWTKVNEEQRVWGRGSDFAEVKVDPKDENTIYVANTSTYKSTDAGVSFTAWKGAPGGDDYHTIWINPDNPQIILLALDQGATITVNGGETWSSWYNQPTAQFYHVSTDNQFPYWVYGGQQESGSIGIASRGNDGEITFREWHPVGAEEYGYIAPDPLNPNIVYGGKITKFDKVTGQVQDVSPPGDHRFVRTAPILFSPVDPHTLFYAGEVVFKTTDGGHSWTTISPDLTREHPAVPDSVGVYRAESPTVARRGVVYALGPSYRDIDVLWAGTDDGLVQMTRDGGRTWMDVTPRGVDSWSKVSQIDAGHFDTDTAYVAVNRMRLDDMRPHIYRTHDGGKNWAEIVSGLPEDAPVDTVREDPVRKGLLYCGTENAVFFSLDDGETWNPLRLNMPATSIRDLVVHGDDLVAGTHGRSFWILDDIDMLRQMASTPSNEPILFKPEVAYRYRRDTNSDTPLPPEVPAGKNPPDGAILDYFLPGASANPVTLEIYDSNNRLVRRYSSADKPQMPDPKQLDVPMYWVRKPHILTNGPGHHRFVWDMFWQPTAFVPFYPISAVYLDTPPVDTSPLAMPGQYTARLTVDGRSYSQPLTLKMDPRVKAGLGAIAHQFALAKGCYDYSIRMAEDAAKYDTGKAAAPRRFRRRGSGGGDTFASLAQSFGQMISWIDGADMEPTANMQSSFDKLKKQADDLEAKAKKA